MAKGLVVLKLHIHMLKQTFKLAPHHQVIYIAPNYRRDLTLLFRIAIK